MFCLKRLLAMNPIVLRPLITQKRLESTIFALSSGPTRAALAVIRVSGPHAPSALKTITRRTKLPEPRKATLMTLYNINKDDNACDVLDKALVLYFASPGSYTGETSFELHVHGGQAVIQAVMHNLSLINHLRPAQKGEFTKRALLNNKLTLEEAENINDLINADTEKQRQSALKNLENGELYNITLKWRQNLKRLLAHVEAHIDFDEEELDNREFINSIFNQVDLLRNELEHHLKSALAKERLRNGVQICILGRPNVGKSSLLNLLLKRDAAIVSELAGTTRDRLEMNLDINGYPVCIVDTAGLRRSSDSIEIEGIKRALDSAKTADIVLIVLDALKILETSLEEQLNLVKSERSNVDNNENIEVIVVNKIDLVEKLEKFEKLEKLEESIEVDLDRIIEDERENGHFDHILMSCKTSRGLDQLIECLTKHLMTLCNTDIKESPVMTRARHRQHVERALMHLDAFGDHVSNEQNVVFAAEELRKAIKEIGHLGGQVSNNELLDLIFAEFCIGK